MSPTFCVRPATVEDASIIGRHRAKMFSDMGQLPSHLFESFLTTSTERVRELLRCGEYVGWLASPRDTPQQVVAGGGAQLRRVLPHPAGEHAFAEGRQAVIINVYTEPEWRRRGIGEMLIKEVIEWSKIQKLDRLVLHASEHGRGLYERLGFVLTNEMKYVG